MTDWLVAEQCCGGRTHTAVRVVAGGAHEGAALQTETQDLSCSVPLQCSLDDQKRRYTFRKP